MELYENKINVIEDEKEKENNNLKIYEHITITSFPVKNNYNESSSETEVMKRVLAANPFLFFSLFSFSSFFS